MTKRSKSIERILQVQLQLKRDADLRLARAAAERRRLDAEELDLVEAMSRDDAPGFALAKTGGARLRSLLKEQRQAQDVHASCEAHYKSVATRTVCVERLHLTVMRADRQAEEKRILEELIEQEWSRATSLP